MSTPTMSYPNGNGTHGSDVKDDFGDINLGDMNTAEFMNPTKRDSYAGHSEVHADYANGDSRGAFDEPRV